VIQRAFSTRYQYLQCDDDQKEPDRTHPRKNMTRPVFFCEFSGLEEKRTERAKDLSVHMQKFMNQVVNEMRDRRGTSDVFGLSARGTISARQRMAAIAAFFARWPNGFSSHPRLHDTGSGRRTRPDPQWEQALYTGPVH
jgi:hypothetical protein